jgi:LysM repeat protein
MKTRSKAPARLLALLALAGAVVAVVLVVQGATGGDDSAKRSPAAKQAKQKKNKPKPPPPKVYVVRSGDNLTTIAQKTGVPVAVIERLNPTVDPLSLIEGEKLKLR